MYTVVASMGLEEDYNTKVRLHTVWSGRVQEELLRGRTMWRGKLVRSKGCSVG